MRRAALRGPRRNGSHRRWRGIAIAVAVAVAPRAQGAPAAEAQDAPPAPAAAPGPGSAPAPAGGSPATPTPAESAGWFDASHAVLEQTLGAVVLRFDQFFADDHDLDLEHPESRLRVSVQERSGQDRAFAFGESVNGTVRLPALERILHNLRLVITGIDEPANLPNPVVQDQAGTPPAGLVSPVLTPQPLQQGAAELRFDLLRTRLLVFDAGGGANLGWPIIPYARVRGHLVAELGPGLLLRFTETAFAEAFGVGPGESTDFSLDRFLGPAVRLELAGSSRLAVKTQGLEWVGDVNLAWTVDRRTALYTGASTSGYSRPTWKYALSQVDVGIRRDLWEGWLFGQLEPQIQWPLLLTGPHPRVLAIVARLELFLEGRSTRGPAPPPAGSRETEGQAAPR